MVHEGTLAVRARGGRITFEDRRGNALPDAPRPAATGADLDELDAYLRSIDVTIDERTNEPKWEGDRIDLDYIVSELCRRSGACPRTETPVSRRVRCGRRSRCATRGPPRSGGAARPRALA
jgi:hypothetical protein